MGLADDAVCPFFFDDWFAGDTDPVDLARDGAAVLVAFRGQELAMFQLRVTNVPKVMLFSAVRNAVPANEDASVMREFSARTFGESFFSTRSHHMGEHLRGVKGEFGSRLVTLEHITHERTAWTDDVGVFSFGDFDFINFRRPCAGRRT